MWAVSPGKEGTIITLIDEIECETQTLSPHTYRHLMLAKEAKTSGKKTPSPAIPPHAASWHEQHC